MPALGPVLSNPAMSVHPTDNRLPRIFGFLPVALSARDDCLRYREKPDSAAREPGPSRGKPSAEPRRSFLFLTPTSGDLESLGLLHKTYISTRTIVTTHTGQLQHC
jgi:hypothetical protein